MCMVECVGTHGCKMGPHNQAVKSAATVCSPYLDTRVLHDDHTAAMVKMHRNR